jgi:hypothetical protein
MSSICSWNFTDFTGKVSWFVVGIWPWGDVFLANDNVNEDREVPKRVPNPVDDWLGTSQFGRVTGWKTRDSLSNPGWLTCEESPDSFSYVEAPDYKLCKNHDRSQLQNVTNRTHSRYGDVLKWGYPKQSSIFDWDVPWNKPSSSWG